MHHRNFGGLFGQRDLDGELQGTISLRGKLEAQHGLAVVFAAEEDLAFPV